jgi:hypothetical protein
MKNYLIYVFFVLLVAGQFMILYEIQNVKKQVQKTEFSIYKSYLEQQAYLK